MASLAEKVHALGELQHQAVVLHEEIMKQLPAMQDEATRLDGVLDQLQAALKKLAVAQTAQAALDAERVRVEKVIADAKAKLG